jgi:hypothetical protein
MGLWRELSSRCGNGVDTWLSMNVTEDVELISDLATRIKSAIL